MTDSAKAQRDVEVVMLALQKWAVNYWELDWKKRDKEKFRPSDNKTGFGPSDDFISESIPELAEKYIYFVVPDQAKPSASVTKKQLGDIEKHGRKLLEALRSAQGPAIDALRSEQAPAIDEFEIQLEKLVEAAAQATTSDAKTNTGPKVNKQARHVAAAARDDFEILTQLRPTFSVAHEDGKSKTNSAFLDFVSDIFNALGITASAEHYAREALRDMETFA